MERRREQTLLAAADDLSGDIQKRRRQDIRAVPDHDRPLWSVRKSRPSPACVIAVMPPRGRRPASTGPRAGTATAFSRPAARSGPVLRDARSKRGRGDSPQDDHGREFDPHAAIITTATHGEIPGGLIRRLKLHHAVEAPAQAGEARHAADARSVPAMYGSARSSRVVAYREPLARKTEENLDGGYVTRQSHRMGPGPAKDAPRASGIRASGRPVCRLPARGRARDALRARGPCPTGRRVSRRRSNR